MTTTTEKKLTIVLSDAPPVIVDAGVWPCIAVADWYSGQHECQANEKAYVKVREHADGRRIVYGSRHRGPGGMPINYEGAQSGFLVDCRVSVGQGTLSDTLSDETTAATIRAIRRVAGAVDMPTLGNQCIADLPAVELT
jgi:hypothetical protein